MADYSLPNLPDDGVPDDGTSPMFPNPLFMPTTPTRAHFPAPRLQSMTLPNGRFLLVLDSWPGDLADDSALHNMLREGTGAASVWVFRQQVDVFDAEPITGDPCEMLPSVEDEAMVARLRQAYVAEAARQEAAGIELTEWRSAMWRALGVRPSYVEDPRALADADGALRERAVRTIVELRTDLRAAQDRINALLREGLTEDAA